MSSFTIKLVFFEHEMPHIVTKCSYAFVASSVRKCLDYRLAVKHTKPHLLSVFHDCWRIIPSERNRGGLSSSLCYGDFGVTWAGVDVMFADFVFFGSVS
jgi:hypothetical protein